MRLDSCLLEMGRPSVPFAYVSITSAVLVYIPRLAGLAGLPPADAARLASQCASLLLRCGAVALRSQPAPQEAKLNCLATVLLALEHTFLLVQKATHPDDKAAFLRHAPPAFVTDLLRAACTTLSATPTEQQRPGAGAVHGPYCRLLWLQRYVAAAFRMPNWTK